MGPAPWSTCAWSPANCRWPDVRQQVALSLITEFENFSTFTPGDHNLPALETLLDQVVAWSTALASLRQATRAAAG